MNCSQSSRATVNEQISKQWDKWLLIAISTGNIEEGHLIQSRAQGMLHTQLQPLIEVFHVPSSLHSLTNLLLIITWWRKHYHFHFTDEQTQAQRWEVTVPKPHSSHVLVLRSDSNSWAPNNCPACWTDCLLANKVTLELCFEGLVWVNQVNWLWQGDVVGIMDLIER